MNKLHYVLISSAIVIFGTVAGFHYGSVQQKRHNCVDNFVRMTDGKNPYTRQSTTPICNNYYSLI